MCKVCTDPDRTNEVKFANGPSQAGGIKTFIDELGRSEGKNWSYIKFITMKVIKWEQFSLYLTEKIISINVLHEP